MLDWLKTLVGAGAPVKNRADLPPDAVKSLRKDLGRLESLRTGVADRLLRYVLDGEDADALRELGRLTGASEALRLHCIPQGYYLHRPERREFLERVARHDAAVYLRLAKVYEAASGTDPRRLTVSTWAGGLEWLEVFLREATHFSAQGFFSGNDQTGLTPRFGAEVIEEMLRLDGADPAAFARGALEGEATPRGWGETAPMFLRFKGLADSFARHPQAVREMLGQPRAEARTYALKMLRDGGAPLAAFVETLADQAVGSSKQARLVAEELLKREPALARPPLETLAGRGNPEQRGHAVRLLWTLLGEEARPFLGTRRQEETSAKVLATLAEVLDGTTTGKQEAAGDPLALEPIVGIERPMPADENLLAEIRLCAEAEQDELRMDPRWSSAQRAEHAFRLLQTYTPPPDLGRSGSSHPAIFWNREFYQRLWEHPDLRPIHVVRLLLLAHSMAPTDEDRAYWFFRREDGDDLERYRRSRPSGVTFGLRELAAAFGAVGLDPEVLGRHVIENLSRQKVHWSAPQIWPYFVERPEALEEALGVRPPRANRVFWLDSDRRRHAFTVLAAFPAPPANLTPKLWDLAMGAKPGESDVARRLLEKTAEGRARVLFKLGSGSAAERAVAAEWLGRLGDPAAVPALRAALKKETRDALKVAMMDALAALGVPADEFLDRAGLAKEAAKGLAKGIPADLAWFPFNVLPAVRWADTGEAVAPEVVRWFVVQSYRLKSPEPNALLRRYAAGFEKTGRESLGRFVLTAWIAQDTIRMHSPAEAAALAETSAQQAARHHPNVPREQIYQNHYHHLLKILQGSAIGQKGILAVAGACAGPDIVPAVAAYLKEWYGQRTGQCRALVQMLAWVDHPVAIQLLLSVGNRFRTKGIQEEAARQVQALAGRRGWTLEELADRTAPAAGFNENGVLELPFGDARTFSARLGEEFIVKLFNAEGKPIAALPEPNAADDPERAKASKTALAAARKELKAAVKSQTERLYEAMCVGRAWRLADWDQHLNRHPIVGRLGQRLVWAVFAEGKFSRAFRPLADRTLTDPADEAVTPTPGAEVRLAHGTFLPATDAAAWRTHFADYAVEPLFPQFGETIYKLPEDARERTEITDFHGHVLEAYKLRGRATKLGYSRDLAEDGGWFYRYRKGFPTLGLEAVIEFTGSALPEENRIVALRGLSFTRREAGDAIGGNARHRSGESGGVSLGELSPVLLSECWNDLRRIAAEGAGFDLDWEKKTTL